MKLSNLYLAVSLFLLSLLPVSAQVFRNPQNGHYYKISSQLDTFPNMASAAVAEGGYLVQINNAAEQSFLELTVLPHVPNDPEGPNVWIGLSDAAVENQFVWLHDGSVASYVNWNVGEPNNFNDEDVVEMFAGSGKWFDQAWDRTRRAVIEFEGMPTCTHPVTGNRYTFTPMTATLTTARSMAAGIGGHLASVTSADEQAFIAQQLGAWIDVLTVANGPGIWIGLSDFAQEGVFKWDDGSAPGYTNWSPGEPNNAGDEDGTQMLHGSFKWNDAWTYSLTYGLIEIDHLALVVDAYQGAGSIRVAVRTDYPGAFALTVFTFNTFGVGSGWFFGINPFLEEVVGQYSSGSAPYFSVLNGQGDAVFQVPSGVPAGLSIAAVSVILDGNLAPADATPPVTFTTL